MKISNFLLVLGFFLLLIFNSCTLASKGTLFNYVIVGKEETNYTLYLSVSNTNILVSSLDELLFYSSSDLKSKIYDNSDEMLTDEIFYWEDFFSLKMAALNSQVFLINFITNGVAKVLSISENSIGYLGAIFFTNQEWDFETFFVNHDKSLVVLFRLPSEIDYNTLYKISVFRISNSLYYPHPIVSQYILTNVFSLSKDKIGNVYVFQVVGGKVLLSIFSSYLIFVRNVEFAFDDTLEPVSALSTWDGDIVIMSINKTNDKVVAISSYRKDTFEKLNNLSVGLPKNQTFSLVGSRPGNIIIGAGYKDGYPYLILFDPFSSVFSPSKEVLLDFRYDRLIRGYAISDSGNVFIGVINTPENNIVFYRW